MHHHLSFLHLKRVASRCSGFHFPNNFCLPKNKYYNWIKICLFLNNLFSISQYFRPSFARPLFICCLKRGRPAKRRINKQKKRVNFSFNLYKNVLIMARDRNWKLTGDLTTCALNPYQELFTNETKLSHISGECRANSYCQKRCRCHSEKEFNLRCVTLEAPRDCENYEINHHGICNLIRQLLFFLLVIAFIFGNQRTPKARRMLF